MLYKCAQKGFHCYDATSDANCSKAGFPILITKYASKLAYCTRYLTFADFQIHAVT